MSERKLVPWDVRSNDVVGGDFMDSTKTGEGTCTEHMAESHYRGFPQDIPRAFPSSWTCRTSEYFREAY